LGSQTKKKSKAMKYRIQEELRLLAEKDENKEYSYGCVMLYMSPPAKFWSLVQAAVKEEDVCTEDGLGRETEPHLTVLYGIHADVPDEDVEAIIDSLKAPELTLNKISIFDTNDTFDVLKFDVEGKGLHDMNAKFAELPHTTDYPDYHPHATIAYLKSGEGEKYIGRLDEPYVLTPSKVVYCKPDGTKKEYQF
jgi:2'-5' RNA ligase|tara:strand:- start:15619 stop:16197 length:579 start_codon:yes stop_codon:yes gene_type:complete